MSKDFDTYLDDMVAKVREIVQANPDFVYTVNESDEGSCAYFPTEGNPNGCIIGYASRECGHSLDGDAYTNVIASTALHRLWGLKESDLWSDPKLRWLHSVQRNQDMDSSWSEAVASANELYPSV